MSDRKYRASLSKGRTGWCAIFRHPVCKSADGRQPLRVRRGLSTRDEHEASRLIGQLDELLADSSYWNFSAKERAEAKYEPQVVSAFFDHLTPEKRDGWADREGELPLPGKDQGYATAQLIGPTGAGKSTVLRQLIGTDPKGERFPSISAARTTVCDLEVILTEGPYKAAVSFLSRDQVRQLIAECTIASIAAHLDASTPGEVVRRFMEHGDMRFRLSYILGSWSILTASADEELLDDDNVAEDVDENAEVTIEDQKVFRARLEHFFERIERIAIRSREQVAKAAIDFGLDLDKVSARDRDALQELVEEQLLQDDDFHALVDEILDDVEERFAHVTDGSLDRGRDGWPRLWTYQTDDREVFIKNVNRFSSNYAPNFGRLLTPMVEGIRVCGPFAPQWYDEECPRFVLLDGQGIGHTADTTSSVSTNVTKRFPLADVIVLVDNAAQPMQAAPVAVLRTVVTSGHESKLAVVFTHFDEVKGDNLRRSDAKMDHVTSSFFNAVQAIGRLSGRDAEQSLRRLIPDRLFFLSKIQEVVSEGSKFTRRELSRLAQTILASIIPPPPAHYRPVYDVANLVLAIQRATQEFHDRWRGILGTATRSGAAPEHWTRVKALTRRIGVMNEEEYDTLKPTANLIDFLQTQISKFLSEPLKWNPGPVPEDRAEEKSQATNAIRQEVFSRLHTLAHQRLIDERLSGWVEAYEHRGTGSTRLRAKDLVLLYESAAPVPNEMPGPDLNEFLFEVRELVVESIEKEKGEVIGWKRAELS